MDARDLFFFLLFFNKFPSKCFTFDKFKLWNLKIGGTWREISHRIFPRTYRTYCVVTAPLHSNIAIKSCCNLLNTDRCVITKDLQSKVKRCYSHSAWLVYVTLKGSHIPLRCTACQQLSPCHSNKWIWTWTITTFVKSRSEKSTGEKTCRMEA